MIVGCRGAQQRCWRWAQGIVERCGGGMQSRWPPLLLLRRLFLSALPLVLLVTVLQAVAALLLLISFLVAQMGMKPMASGAVNVLEAGYLCSPLAIMIAGLSTRFQVVTLLAASGR